MPSVTAISSGVRPRGPSPCLSPRKTPAHPSTQLSLQVCHSFLALECRFTRSSLNTYVCSCASIRPAVYLYEHMFPRSTPSPLTRRARNALSLARSFLLLEDDYDVDWEVDQNEPGQGSARGRRGAAGGEDSYLEMPGTGSQGDAALHPHRSSIRRRTVRERAGQPPAHPYVCLSPVSPAGPVSGSSDMNGRTRGDRAPRRRDQSASSSTAAAPPNV